MFLGTGTTSSVIHAAGSGGAGSSAAPKALVVLVKTKQPTAADTASSRRTRVPVTFVSTNAWAAWVATCGLWSVAACATAPAPRRHSRTNGRSTIDPTASVRREARRSIPRTSRPAFRSISTSASPRWPALPVTTILMRPQGTQGIRAHATPPHGHTGGNSNSVASSHDARLP